MTTYPADVQSALGPVLSEYGITSASVVAPTQTVVVTGTPVIVAPSPAFDFGWNIGGIWPTQSAINDSGFGLIQLQEDIANLGSGRFVRAWQTGSIQSAPADSQFTQTRFWTSLGLKPIMVYNTQNNVPRCMCPSTAQIQTYFNGLPSSSDTGIWGVELVNEHDYTAYYTDTYQNLTNLFTIAAPILRSKGYKVIGSNCLSSVGMYQDGILKTALQNKVVDYIGRHAYEQTAAAALADHAKVKALADSYGVGYLCTEVGLKNANFVTELPKLWAGLKALGGIYLGFTLYQFSGNTSANNFANNPFTSPGVQNVSNFNAIKAGLA